MVELYYSHLVTLGLPLPHNLRTAPNYIRNKFGLSCAKLSSSWSQAYPASDKSLFQQLDLKCLKYAQN